MILPDVNVLIYAFRADVPEHATCKAWLDGVIAGSAGFGISPMVLSAVVRIATSSRIFRSPSTLDETFQFCDYLRDLSHCTLVEPGERHWDIFQHLCRQTNTRDPQVSDVWFAALAIEWGCEWISCDKGFARFPGLSWHNPMASG